MSGIAATGAADAQATAGAAKPDPKVYDAAVQFEGIFMSMLVGEMMKGSQTERANPIYAGLVTEKLGDQIARQGGIGLASILERQLRGVS